MGNKIRAAAVLLFVVGIVFLLLFRANLTGNITSELDDGEKVYTGMVSGVYLTIAIFVLLISVFIYLYYRYEETPERNLIGFVDYLKKGFSKE